MKLSWMDILREQDGAASAGGQENSSSPPPPAGAQEGAGESHQSPPAPKPGSIYEDTGVEEPGKNGSTAWPDDWRKQMVNGVDEADKALNVLNRYQSPADVAKALLSTRQRVSTGEYTRALPTDASEDQIKEWRVEQGIPEEPSGYELPVSFDGKLDDMDDNQKAVYEGWQKEFHQHNIKPEVAKELVSYANDVYAAQLEAQATHDAKTAENQEEALRTDWGAEFRTNVKMNLSYLNNALGEDAAKEFLNARMPDGTAMKHSVAISKMLNEAARGAGLTSSFEGGEVMTGQSLLDKKAEIEKLMSTDLAAYSKRKPEYTDILTKLTAKGVIDASGRVIKDR